jgi:hypothetical protein
MQSWALKLTRRTLYLIRRTRIQIIEQLELQELPVMGLTVSPVYQVSSDLTPRGRWVSNHVTQLAGSTSWFIGLIGWPRLDVESDLVGFKEPEYPAN